MNSAVCVRILLRRSGQIEVTHALAIRRGFRPSLSDSCPTPSDSWNGAKIVAQNVRTVVQVFWTVGKLLWTVVHALGQLENILAQVGNISAQLEYISAQSEYRLGRLEYYSAQMEQSLFQWEYLPERLVLIAFRFSGKWAQPD